MDAVAGDVGSGGASFDVQAATISSMETRARAMSGACRVARMSRGNRDVELSR